MASKIPMGYCVKVQKVERPTNRSYYVNLPVVLAEAINLQKGEQWEWAMEDQNTLILTRVKKQEKRRQAAKR
jgi:antitoxin component of MazEF toxin-antitoxin module